MLQGPQEWVCYSDVLCPDVAAGTKKYCWFLHTDFSAPRCLQEGLASTTMHAKVQATHFEEKKKKQTNRLTAEPPSKNWILLKPNTILSPLFTGWLSSQ